MHVLVLIKCFILDNFVVFYQISWEHDGQYFTVYKRVYVEYLPSKKDEPV